MRRSAFPGLLVVAAALAACGRGTPSAGADTTRAAPPAAAVTTPANGELASSRTFNSLLGDFQLAVPDVWEQRYTATERVKAAEYPGARSVSEFMFLPVSGGTPPVLLRIIQYPEAEWKVVSSSGKGPGPVVAEGGGRVFAAQLLAANPFPAGSEDAVAIAPMLLTAEQVSRAMRIQQDGTS
jgi:hypothetical protein